MKDKFYEMQRIKIDRTADGDSDEPISIASEPHVIYGKNVDAGNIYINPFVDWAFKRIFAS